MREDETLQILKQILRSHRIVAGDGEALNEQARFEDLRMDSISMLELITAVEEEFDITFDLDELNIDALTTIGSFVALIDKKVTERVGPE